MKALSSTEELSYRVGALLYSPASKKGVADKILNQEIPRLTSVALCLEDAIQDDYLDFAEKELFSTLSTLKNLDELSFTAPMTFVRVRNPEHLKSIADKLLNRSLSITGFILPKFDTSNGVEYIDVAKSISSIWRTSPYIMPILESGVIASPCTRSDELRSIKEILDPNKNMILNVRVGGNDFCNLLGMRRNYRQNIYQLGPVRDALIDIVAVFGTEYVVSGPVWEYFGSKSDSRWQEGLISELALDKANGFIGKTAIHPCQVPLINEALKVNEGDYEDALKILSWNKNDAVGKSSSGIRMDEIKTHLNWAKRISILANAYGVKGELE